MFTFYLYNSRDKKSLLNYFHFFFVFFSSCPKKKNDELMNSIQTFYMFFFYSLSLSLFQEINTSNVDKIQFDQIAFDEQVNGK